MASQTYIYPAECNVVKELLLATEKLMLLSTPPPVSCNLSLPHPPLPTWLLIHNNYNDLSPFVAPSDYTAVQGMGISIGSGDIFSYCVNLITVDDEILEKNETFTVELSNFSPSDTDLLISPASIKIAIIDNDSEL